LVALNCNGTAVALSNDHHHPSESVWESACLNLEDTTVVLTGEVFRQDSSFLYLVYRVFLTHHRNYSMVGFSKGDIFVKCLHFVYWCLTVALIYLYSDSKPNSWLIACW